ncbi:MAG: right-handed parallel beta-helix repeat-containing protein [Saprospiraceae bacterium]
MPQITIGNLSGTGAPNRFIAYNGISADNTNLEVFNTMFEDLPSGTGIRLRGTGGVYSAQISGFGNAPSDPVFIKNYSIGVSSQNYNLTIQDAYFNGAGMQQISINNGQLPTRLVLTKNRFDQFEQDAVTVSLSTLREVNVAENEFYDDNSSVQGLEKTGIRWSNNQMATPAATGIIRENLFYDEAKTSSDPVFFQFTSIGVYVNGASQLGIKKNYFYQNYDSDIDHNFSGIQLNNASENELVENSTTGNHGPLTATNPGFAYHGIQLRESPKNFLSCNQSQNLNRGIAFHGPACDKTNFVQNIMEDNHTGLYLAPGTIMGVQAIRENKWEGDLPTGGIAEAHFDGTPGLGLLQMSLFQINSSNTNSSFWATPRIPASGWFLFAGTQVALAYSCLQDAEPFPPKSEAESMLIGGGFENYKDYPASGWEMSLSAFGVLAEYPELRPANSPEESFYETHISGNVGKLQRARMTWDDIALFSTSLEAGWASNTADIDQKLGAIKTETLAMEAASTPAEQVQIAATLEALKTELESLLQTNQSLSAQYQSDVSAKANDLAADLAEINATEDWENNLKTVLQLSVERLLAGTGEWTTTQQTTLESIADQCRHEGGIGVVLARSAIEKFDYDDEAMCPGWVDERTAPGAALNASIFPNPANTVCRISFKEPVRGTLHIRNMQGLMVQSLTLADVPTVTINTEKWPAGLYVVSAIADSGVRFTSKIAISH